MHRARQFVSVRSRVAGLMVLFTVLCFAESAAPLLDYACKIQSFAFQESTKRNMRTQLNAYLLFCDHFALIPFPVSNESFLAHLAFLSKSLTCYHSLINYINILKHINRSLGADFSFMLDYDAFFAQWALPRVMGDSVHFTHPVTVDILLNVFHHFDWPNQLHVCMHAAFLVAFFSFLRIYNLVPYTASCQSVSLCQEWFLECIRTKTIQFKQHALEIPLPFIPNSVSCPVTALQNYFRTVPSQASLHLFVVNHCGSL